MRGGDERKPARVVHGELVQERETGCFFSGVEVAVVVLGVILDVFGITNFNLIFRVDVVILRRWIKPVLFLRFETSASVGRCDGKSRKQQE